MIIILSCSRYRSFFRRLSHTMKSNLNNYAADSDALRSNDSLSYMDLEDEEY